MDQQEWLASTDPQTMLAYLNEVTASVYGHPVERARRSSERKLRLFAVACCRAVWQQFNTKESRAAVEAAELYADGLIGRDELGFADHLADHASCPHDPAETVPSLWIAHADLTGRPLESILGFTGPPATQAALLRDLVGNPFRHHETTGHFGAFSAGWLTWNGGTVPRLAQQMYDSRDFSGMPVLHDALVDAGCTDEEILQHCLGRERCWVCDEHGTVYSGGVPPYSYCGRCGGTRFVPLRAPHVRGCWVADLFLGKE